MLWLVSRVTSSKEVAIPEHPREILVLRPNDYGDLLTATPIFDALRRRFPSTRLIAGVGRWGRPILENNPHVDEIVELDVPWNNKFVADLSWKAVTRFLLHSDQVLALKGRGGFDIGIDVLGSHVGAVLMMRLGVRYRVGIRGYRGGWSACQQYTRFSNDVHVARAALNQAVLLGATDLPEARPQLFPSGTERSEAAGLWGIRQSSRHCRILLGPGAGFEDKCWPSKSWREAISASMRQFKLMGLSTQVLIVGGAKDQPRAAEIVNSLDSGVLSLCGQTTLRTTFALAEQADLVLTNPSMLLHVAAAFHKPTITVLGGTYSNGRAHDRLWGYPMPYQSVGSERGDSWPTVEKVIDAIVSKAAMMN